MGFVGSKDDGSGCDCEFTFHWQRSNLEFLWPHQDILEKALVQVDRLSKFYRVNVSAT